MDFNEFKLAVKKAAINHNISDFDLYYNLEKQLEYTAYQGEIEKFSGSKLAGVCFRCLINGKMGYASTELLSKEEAELIVKKAKQSALEIDSKDSDFIYDGAFENIQTAEQEKKENDSEQVLPSDLVNAAITLEKLPFEKEKSIKSVSDCMVVYYANETQIYISSSANTIDKSLKNKYFAAVCEPVIEEDGVMYSSYSAGVSNKFAMLDLDKLAQEATKEVKDSVCAVGLESGSYKTVLSNKAMASLLDAYSGVFSSENAQHNLSLFKDKENTKIAADILTITDDPACEQAFINIPFDAQGVKTYKKNVIENGVLKTLLYNLKTAAKENKKTTANAFKASYDSSVSISPFNFYIKPQDVTTQQLLSQVKDGVFITKLKGVHSGANTESGDFSLEASGYLIKNGEISTAVSQFTVSGNFYEVLKEIKVVCDDLYFDVPSSCAGSFGSPTVYVGNLAFAGETK